MNLKNLSDDGLLRETKKLAQEEKGLLTKLLWHIKEVDTRRLFSKLKYESINKYVEFELGYSNDEAWRRVEAARLLSEIPEIGEKIGAGQLNLTNICLAQALFKKEKREAKMSFSLEKKKEVLSQISGKTTRQAAKIIWSHSTMPVPEFREQIRELTDEFCEYNFKADKETQQAIERLKGLRAHSFPGMTLSELIKQLCDLGLKEWDPALKTERRLRNTRSGTVTCPPPRPNSIILESQQTGTKESSRLKFNAEQSNRTSKAEQSRQTWRQAQSKCTNCSSYYALQEDHRIPMAKGGDDSPENKRLLCRNCNQRAAIEHFGIKKMQMYLKSPEVTYVYLA